FALAGELEQAYFAYLLCADNVDAALLSSKIAQIGEQDLPYTEELVDRARERVARVDIRYGGVETADGVFDVALAAGSVVTIAGKFVVINGVKVLRTAAGLVVWKEAADYLKAKGVTLWDSVGNLFGRTATKGEVVKPLVNSATNVASEARTTHILYGDTTGGGHLWPGGAVKTAFPQSWDANKVMNIISDIATDPKLSWKAQTGSGGLYTKSGKPARFIVTDSKGNLPVVDGVPVKVVIEPAGEGIITGHPKY
ncbi:EndoU domain-containing protein, partial [Thalassospira alkalitolerans]|uniref:EndoU domain-containing protein n=2 Tax=Alphaproteobacteria TaxID=28211 RepID=UPI003AA7F9BC